MYNTTGARVQPAGAPAQRSRLAAGRPALVALGLATAAWLALLPWQPRLAGDDWGYVESVVLTLLHGRPIVSDWLAPATVGFTLPAALAVRLTGDLWLGSAVALGLFGLAGLAGLERALARLGASPSRRALAVLALAVSPIWLNKWTAFESAVPAAALLLVALALFLEWERRPDTRPGVVALAAASACLAWAIAIRQHQLVAVALGALVIARRAPSGQRLVQLVIWLAPPALVLAGLRFAVPASFAQRHALEYRLFALLTPGEYLATVVRALFFSAGLAFVLRALSAPGSVSGLWRRWTRGQRLSAVAGPLVLGAAALLARGDLGWLGPQTDTVLLAPAVGLSAALVLAGSVVWSDHLPRPGEPSARRALALLAAGYVALIGLWGYWEYYLLEPMILLLAAGLVPAGAREDAQPGSPRARRLALAALVLLASLTWTTQRLYNDYQAAWLAAVEGVLRAGLARPGELDRAALPFGLAGWNLFGEQVARWEREPQGDPMAVWELFSPEPAVVWRLGCPPPGSLPASAVGAQVLRSGLARMGLQDYCWELIRVAATAPGASAAPHRYLPLTPAEWQAYLAAGGRP